MPRAGKLATTWNCESSCRTAWSSGGIPQQICHALPIAFPGPRCSPAGGYQRGGAVCEAAKPIHYEPPVGLLVSRAVTRTPSTVTSTGSRGASALRPIDRRVPCCSLSSRRVGFCCTNLKSQRPVSTQRSATPRSAAEIRRARCTMSCRRDRVVSSSSRRPLGTCTAVSLSHWRRRPGKSFMLAIIWR